MRSLITFVFNFIVFGLIFYGIHYYFPDAFAALVSWAEALIHFVKEIVLFVVDKIRGMKS